MASLYPTPTRLALLADIDAGLVYAEANHWWHKSTAYRLDAQIRDMDEAGWLEAIQHPEMSTRLLARLTPAGRAVMERGRPE